ncbi:uncharacterized protein NFIA_113050 [Aspergillus fischeri NRRL 181]|uniref:Uncharacterized protein n=1 Tax=Neosartorya fischeri (strain ATCC 1020 / DSM 3700 / CBS 544.65 / FGSC A1164 / JCM 1740 / NRRL 181 / WB 181) TaxID=331117 RepID=A1D8R6_NEOFI|nr:uncharacterized protein NFIA_113050 [Aspergillus fischeri NRRL 181]EAW20777.1 hypothetical protein NFIA_113050 [Aspergillus fischeri NRRL 181]KAG2002847.1 hypothetical protein GB937_009499 [Aspergillus fischeri]
MKLLATFLLLAAAVTACKDPAYRCKNPQGTKSSDYSKTVEICSEVADGASMCYCYGAAEDYCYLEDAEKVKKFIDYCKRDDPWYAAAFAKPMYCCCIYANAIGCSMDLV